MRFHHIKQQLNEINMSPSSLRNKAARINALVGIEYEMYVPDVSVDDGNENMEPDYDVDIRVKSIGSIMNFFNEDAMIPMSNRGARELETTLQERYGEFVEEDFQERWRDEEEDAVREKIMDTWDEHEAIANNLEELGVEDINAAVKAHRDNDRENPLYDMYLEALKMARTDLEDDIKFSIRHKDDNYEEAKDEFREEYEGPSEYDFLQASGLHYMKDVADEFDLEWPYYTSSTPTGEMSIAEVAEEFSRMIGREVKAGNGYHSVIRDGTSYVLEPDGSLDEPESSEDGGLEFVSPPLSLNDAFSDLNKVKQWAEQKGCYTNHSTGLHINVSVSDYSMEKLDYVKLALLLGDQYVLKQFGREANNYAKSAINKIMMDVRSGSTQNEERLDLVFRKMRNHLEISASKLIHSGYTDKYTSINTKDGYIEFRSPGGDWLGENFGLIENTILRFVVALDSAIDPNKDRKEYLTKLYKLLDIKQVNDPLAYFAAFAAGELPHSALKSFIRALQLPRMAARGQPKPVNRDFIGKWLILNKQTKEYVASVSGFGNTTAAADNYLRLWGRRNGVDINNYTIVPEIK